MKNKKLLFCTHEQFYPLTGGCTAGNFHIVRYFAQNGFDVTVSTPLYVGREEVEKDSKIKMEPFSPFYMHRKVKFRMVKYLVYGVLSIFHLLRVLRRNSFDVIYVNNAVLALSFLFLKPWIKVPVAIRYTDFLSGFLHEDTKYPRFLVNLLKKYEYGIAKIFDRIYVITDKMKRELCEASNVHPESVIVTLDGVDGQVFESKEIPAGSRKNIREQLNIPLEATLIMFHGTIEPHHGEYIIPSLVKEIVDSQENFYLLLIGVGKGYQRIREALTNNPKVRTLDFVEYREIPKYIDASDIGIVPYPKNHSMDLVLTLKLLEYLSMGTPCVLFDLASVREVFGEYEFVKISKDMDEFLQNIKSLASFGKSVAAVDLIKDRFTWEKVGQTIEKDMLLLCNG